MQKWVIIPLPERKRGKSYMEQTKETVRIQKIIAEKVNPLLEKHLGGMVLQDYADGVMTVKFTGACRACYAAEDTLDNVVKDIFSREMPEVKDILLDNSVDDDLLDFARSLMRGGGSRDGKPSDASGSER